MDVLWKSLAFAAVVVALGGFGIALVRLDRIERALYKRDRERLDAIPADLRPTRPAAWVTAVGLCAMVGGAAIGVFMFGDAGYAMGIVCAAPFAVVSVRRTNRRRNEVIRLVRERAPGMSQQELGTLIQGLGRAYGPSARRALRPLLDNSAEG